MKLTNCQAAVAMWCVTILVLVSSVCAQEASAQKHVGFVEDWSQRSIVFNKDWLAQHPEVMDREPRVRQEAAKRWPIPNYADFTSLEAVPTAAKSVAHKSGQHRDWAYALPGHMAQNAFPAKYQVDAGAQPDCANDFVVFGLNDSGNANLIGLNNIYSGSSPTGLCGTTGPTQLFAYQVNLIPFYSGGHIITSPTISLDGKRIAFVESVPASGGGPAALFHIVVWAATGTGAPPEVPGFPMILSATASDTRSSPFIDYQSDIAYVGTDDGKLHEITGVFQGTPTLDPVGSGWPVTVAAGLHFSPPVVDIIRGLLMVGASDGYLYQIVLANVASGHGVLNQFLVGSGTGSAIVAPPSVDIANGTTFVVTADAEQSSTAALLQLNTRTLTQKAYAELGEGSSQGTAFPLYQPAFSNGYFTTPSDGIVTLCGTGHADTSPYQYGFAFNPTGAMQETPIFSQQLSTSTAARCTGWTEFFNPNIPTNGAGTDYFFFGLTQDCTSPIGGSTDGCVAEETNLTPLTTSPITVTTATITGGPSGIIVDGFADPTLFPQASSIYFTAWKLQDAYKLTQDGLH